MKAMQLTDEEWQLVSKLREEKAKKVFVAKSYFDSEKCVAFDKLYKMALNELGAVQDNGIESKDFDHWCFEAIMNLLGPEVWDAYNEAR